MGLRRTCPKCETFNLLVYGDMWRCGRCQYSEADETYIERGSPKSGWDYRVIKRIFEMPNGVFETQYSIYEVYYDANGDIESWSKEPLYAAGETFLELIQEFKRLGTAFNKPVLNWEELTEK